MDHPADAAIESVAWTISHAAVALVPWGCKPKLLEPTSKELLNFPYCVIAFLFKGLPR